MKRGVTRCLLPLAALAAWAVPAGAEGPSKAMDRPAAQAACPADDRVGGAGMRAFIDPQTGQLREPTREEAQALSRASREEFARAVENLEAVVQPDGTISVDLKGLFMQDLVVVKGPDGSLSMRCVPDAEKAAALATPAPRKPAPALEDR